MWRGLVLAILAACGRVGFERVVSQGDDAAAGDGPGGDSGGPACLPSYLLCDGFEQPAFAGIWSVNTGAVLDHAIAHRGTSSVRMSVPGVAVGMNRYVVLGQTTTLATPGVVHVRAWIRLSALPLDNMELITAAQPSANEDALFVVPGALAVYAQWNDVSVDNGTPPPTGTWMCVLWTVTRATTNTGILSLAGDPPGVTMTNEKTDGMPPVSEMDFGPGFSSTSVTVTQPALDVWFDDVIISTTPVTCAD
jgi:hypothetical protein